jgi:ubiquinone/menaquinone biosynthesis C-methylase UbiE
MFENLTGVVVEIGPGAGANLPFLPKGIMYHGIEPNDDLRKRAELLANQLGFRSAVVSGGFADKLRHADDSVDTVIATFVLCSVSNQRAVLDEIYRVLRSGGQFMFIEHVSAPEDSVAFQFQRLLTPLTRRITCGCELDRDTVSAVKRAGFRYLKSYPTPSIGWKPLGPIVSAVAYKP